MSRLLPHTITGPHLEDLDVSFDDFMASTLQFPPDYKNGHDKDLYTLALQQIRLGIKQGGFGLTSRSLVAPALVYVSLETFSAWFAQYRKFWIGQDSSLRLSWLTPLVAQSSIPQSLIDYSDSAKSQLESYDIQFRAIDQSDAKPKHLLQDINEQLKTYSVNLFRSSPALQQGGIHRLNSLGVQSVPAQSPQSDLNPGEDLDLDDENRDRQTFLRHKPMALFALMCPCELSNTAFVSSAAILLGIPLPHALLLRQHSPQQYGHIDKFGDFLLNNSAHGAHSWIGSHNAIVNMIAHLASEHGITLSSSLVPPASDSSQHKGDLITTRGGLVRNNAGRNFNSQTLLVMDFRLVHVFQTRDHVFKTNTLEKTEKAKRNKYAAAYLEHGHAFAPLVCNSLGQLGPDFLRFLWALADFAARNRIHTTTDDRLPPDPAAASRARSACSALRKRLYNQATTKVLTAVYEGVTERIYGRTFVLRNHPQYQQPLFSQSQPDGRPLSGIFEAPQPLGPRVAGRPVPRSSSTSPRQSSAAPVPATPSRIHQAGSYAWAVLAPAPSAPFTIPPQQLSSSLPSPILVHPREPGGFTANPTRIGKLD